MSAGLRLRPEAEADLQEASRWYESQRIGLGDEFLLEVEQGLTRIQETPRLYTEIHGNVRRSLLRRFPYGIFYIVVEDTVVVLAILHQARNPDRWP
jgi:plasmid stabilization system protein ParE